MLINTAYPIPPYIAYAVPSFLALILGELAWSHFYQKKIYRFNDTVNNLSMGVYSRIFDVFISGIYTFTYFFLYDRVRLWEVPLQSVWGWLLAFILVDLGYYGFHRCSHEIAFLWGSHEGHHQSEEYNLAVALRQSAVQGIFSSPFYLPLAVLGFHPIAFLTCQQLNTIYQFWLHMRGVPKLGPLDWILNTPSHHRVHHAINPAYVDRNYGGMLIVWDRLFGTFQAEGEKAVFGTVKPLRSFNPVWSNFHYWLDLFALTRRANGISDKLKIWLKPPGWKPDYLGGPATVPAVSADRYVKYNPALSPGLALYIFMQFVLAVLVTLLLMLRPEWNSLSLLAASAFVLATLLTQGALMEGRPWAVRAESLRYLLLVASLLLYAVV